ncbi:MAG TPA: methyl-accepting chemotaxis protein, partial [Kineosporiaceae bacterium]|nr:methyl-accepting chemotaxis protein [Kineosporiaceae bacterium]
MLKRTLADRSVRTKILSITVLMALLAGVIAVLAVTRLSAVYSATEDIVNGNLKPLEVLAGIQAGVQKARVDIRELALADAAGKAETAKTIQADDQALDADVAAYLPGAADPAAVRSFQSLWQQWRQQRDEKLVPLAKADKDAEFYQAAKPVALYANQALEQLDKATKAELAEADRSIKEANSTFSAGRNLIIIIALAGLLLGLLCSEYISRQVVGPLQHLRKVLGRVAEGDLSVRADVNGKDELAVIGGATNDTVEKLYEVVTSVKGATGQLSSAAGQVSAAAQSLSQTAAEQAASVEETTAGIEQMASSVNQNSDNAKITDGIAGKAAQQAGEGGQAVQQTVQAMKDIAAKIAIIDDIAFQTNML